MNHQVIEWMSREWVSISVSAGIDEGRANVQFTGSRPGRVFLLSVWVEAGHQGYFLDYAAQAAFTKWSQDNGEEEPEEYGGFDLPSWDEAWKEATDE